MDRKQSRVEPILTMAAIDSGDGRRTGGGGRDFRTYIADDWEDCRDDSPTDVREPMRDAL